MSTDQVGRIVELHNATLQEIHDRIIKAQDALAALTHEVLVYARLDAEARLRIEQRLDALEGFVRLLQSSVVVVDGHSSTTTRE